MLILSQRDPKWGFKTIGNSSSLIKDYGCTITSISMASDYFSCYQNPGWMAKNLQFSVDKVLWQSIPKVLCFGFEYRYYNYNEAAFLEALKNPSKVCLLEYKKRHWVVALKKLPGSWLVADPWTGSKNIYLTSSISGGCVLKK